VARILNEKRFCRFYLLLYSLVFFWIADSVADPGIIPVAKFNSPTMPGGVSEGWSLEKKTGKTLIVEINRQTFFIIAKVIQ
jgi:hypothetical protein